MDVCQSPGGEPGHGGFARFSPKGDRGEVGGIGLDHDTVERGHPGGIPDGITVFISEHARVREVVAHRERSLRLVDCSGEAV